MRVLHVLHNSLPLICGYSIRSANIVRLQTRNGLQLKVVTSAQHPNGSQLQEEIDGVEHRRTPAFHGRQWPIWREWHLMRRLEHEVETTVAAWRPDVIHAHSPVLVGWPALRVAQRHRIPFVYEVRDLWENALVDRGRFAQQSIQYRLARQAETHVISRADVVVTICQTLRDELSHRIGDAGKLHIVSNGVDTQAFRPRPPAKEVRRRYGLHGKRVILYVGTFQPYEGLELLIQSLTPILARRADAHLLIVGGSASLAYQGASARDSLESRLESVIQQGHLKEHVTMTGRIPHEEVADWYALADCVAYPRIRTRTTSLTTPLKPLEAMAMARPVVVSDLPPMRELVRHHETGLTFPAGDAHALGERCWTLLSDAALRDQLGAAAREYVLAERQWPQLVSRYDRVYKAALGELRVRTSSTAEEPPR